MKSYIHWPIAALLFMISLSANAVTPQSQGSACIKADSLGIIHGPTYGMNTSAPISTPFVLHLSPLIAQYMTAGSSSYNADIYAAISGAYYQWVIPAVKSSATTKFSIGQSLPAGTSECYSTDRNPVLGYSSFTSPSAGCGALTGASSSFLAATYSPGVYGVGPFTTAQLETRNVIINADKNFSINGKAISSYNTVTGTYISLPDLQATVAHEFGHVYGINHQYTPYAGALTDGGGVCGPSYGGGSGPGNPDTGLNYPSPNPNGLGTCYADYIYGTRLLETMSAVGTIVFSNTGTAYPTMTNCQRTLSPHDIGAINKLYP
jgi:hypothetical protein